VRSEDWLGVRGARPMCHYVHPCVNVLAAAGSGRSCAGLFWNPDWDRLYSDVANARGPHNVSPVREDNA